VLSVATSLTNAVASLTSVDDTLSRSLNSLADQIALKATTSYVSTQISNLVNDAPSTLDNLAEIAAALTNNNTATASITAALATKANSADTTTLSIAIGTKANQSDLTSLTTVVNGKADLAAVNTLTAMVTAINATETTLTADVNNLKVMVANDNLIENGITWMDLSRRADELYVYIARQNGTMNADGTPDYSINLLNDPILQGSMLAFVVDANYTITSVSQYITIQFDPVQTIIKYTNRSGAPVTISIAPSSTGTYTLPPITYSSVDEYANTVAPITTVTALPGSYRKAPVNPVVTVPKVTIANYKYATPTVMTPYAAPTWSDATGLIAQPITINAMAGAPVQFNLSGYQGVTIEAQSGATAIVGLTNGFLVSSSSTYLVKYTRNVIGPGTISVKALNSFSNTESNVLTIANVFNDYS
jgi:hypothetical protein